MGKSALRVLVTGEGWLMKLFPTDDKSDIVLVFCEMKWGHIGKLAHSRGIVK
jgi:hypothetical protein